MTGASEGQGARRLAGWLLVLALAAAWPIANFLNNNWSQLVPSDFTRAARWWLVLTIALSAGVVLVARLQRWLSLAQLVLAAAVGLILFFLFEWLVDQLRGLVARLGLPGASVLLAYLIVAAVVLAAVSWLARSAPGRRILVTFLVVGSGLSLAQAAFHAVSTDIEEHHAPPAKSLLPAGAMPAARPNVLFVIVDGYGRRDVLSKVAAFDNQEVVRALQERGFTVLKKSVANYPVTYLSVSSILAANYLALPEQTYTTRGRFYDTIQGNNALVATLRQLGYAYVHSGNTWGGSSCSGREDLCLNSFERVAASELDLELVKMTPLRLLLPDVVVSTERGNVALLVRELDHVYAKQPVVLFAHSMPPHPPFEWNADCSKKKQLPDLQTWQRPAEYAANISCVNRQLVQLADAVSRRDPDAIMVFLADHGSSFNNPFEAKLDQWTDDMIAERFPNFAAIKLPERCRTWLKDDLSNVNVVRVVAACIGGVAPTYLPDRFFTGAHERHPSFGHVHEITQRVDSLHLR
jgi:hypothetical protein